jgi:hypothetical protein
LASGFTGLAYFTFDNEPSFQYASILDTAGNPTSLYPIVADLNKEAANLGKALRFMTSTDIKYIPGRHTENSTFVKNPTPLGMTDWSSSNDPDDHIQSFTIESINIELNALIGFFTDDNGDDAFMITSTFHGPSVAPTAAFAITVQFDDSIQSILELDRLTGQQVIVPIPANHRLTLGFPAGTGRLFKYNEGDFLLAAVPEPVTLASMLCGPVLAWISFYRSSLRRRD